MDIYTPKDSTVAGREYLKCCARDNCVASLICAGDLVSKGKKGWNAAEHATHCPDFNKVEAELALGTAKQLAIDDPFAKTADIWDKATQDTSLGIQCLLPTEHVFKGYIRKYKKSNYQFRDPKLLVHLNIPPIYAHTFRREKFL